MKSALDNQNIPIETPKTTSVFYPWLYVPWRILQDYLALDRVPHALLLYGSEGVGKTYLANRFANMLLCQNKEEIACGRCSDCYLFLAGTHPDVLQVQPAEKGKAIGVDAIRHLVHQLSLKPHYNGFRIIIITTAHRMNTNASNALLKTLEEPAAGRTVFLLLAETLSGLPATILSRCQKLPIPTPQGKIAQQWLEESHPGCASTALLSAAHGAPLKALALIESNVVEQRKIAFLEWKALLLGKQEPIVLAERWQNESLEERIGWLLSWTGDLVRRACAPGWPLCNDDLEWPMLRIHPRDVLRLLDYWNVLLTSYRALNGPANRQLLLEEVFIQGARLIPSHEKVY